MWHRLTVLFFSQTGTVLDFLLVHNMLILNIPVYMYIVYFNIGGTIYLISINYPRKITRISHLHEPFKKWCVILHFFVKLSATSLICSTSGLSLLIRSFNLFPLFITENTCSTGAEVPGRQKMYSATWQRFEIEMFWSLKWFNSWSHLSSQFKFLVVQVSFDDHFASASTT